MTQAFEFSSPCPKILLRRSDLNAHGSRATGRAAVVRYRSNSRGNLHPPIGLILGAVVGGVGGSQDCGRSIGPLLVCIHKKTTGMAQRIVKAAAWIIGASRSRTVLVVPDRRPARVLAARRE